MPENNKGILDVTGEKAGNKAKKPFRAAVADLTRQVMRITYGLSEGEVLGFGQNFTENDMLKRIFLDGTPIMSQEGERLLDVQVEFRTGTRDQNLINGLPSVTIENDVNVEVKYNSPVSRSFTRPQNTSYDIRVSVPQLFDGDDEGNQRKGTITFKVEVSTGGGVFVPAGSFTINERIINGYSKTFNIPVSQAAEHTIRISRTNSEVVNEFSANKLVIESIVEVTDVRLRYPNTALLYLQYDAEQFSNIPKLEVRMFGKSDVLVPANYNPILRTYATSGTGTTGGVWDGSFKRAYTDNPCWIWLDLVVSKRYGLGNRVDIGMVDKWQLYTVSQYCDQMVSNGKGGSEPRFTCNNLYLQKAEDAFKVLKDIASIFRSTTVWTGDKFTALADIPRDPVMTFSAANATEIIYRSTDEAVQHNLINAQFYDKDNKFASKITMKRDPQNIVRRGKVVDLNFTATGCTSEGQAQRAAKHILVSELNETELVSFTTGLEGALLRLNDVFYLADEAIAGRVISGRVKAINGRVVTLDRPVPAGVPTNSNTRLALNRDDVATSPIQITAISADRLSVTLLTAPPATTGTNLVWALITADVVPQQFRVTDIKFNEDTQNYSISGITYNKSKYAAIDGDARVVIPPISIVEINLLKAPAVVTATYNVRITQDIAVNDVIVSWSQSENAVSYQVEVQKDGDEWRTVGRVSALSITLENFYNGVYRFRVSALDTLNNQSQYAYSAPLNVAGKVLPPPVLGMYTVVGGLFSFVHNWAFPAHTEDSRGVRIRKALLNPATNPNQQYTMLDVAYPANSFTETSIAAGTIAWFSAAIVDKYGVIGAYTSWVQATVDTNPDKILDVIAGHIGVGELDAALKADLESTKQIATTANSTANTAKAAAQTAQTTADTAKTNAATAQTTANNAQTAANAAKSAADAAQTSANKAGTDATKALADVAKEVTDRTTAVSTERTERLAEVKGVRDGLTTETQQRKDADTSLSTTITNNKASTDTSISNIQTVQSSQATLLGTHTTQISALDSRLTTTDNKAGSALQNAATAQTTANTAVSKADALANTMTTVQADLSATTLTAEAGALLSKFTNAGTPLLDDPAFKLGTNKMLQYHSTAGTFVRAVKQTDNPTSSTHEMVRTIPQSLSGISAGWYPNLAALAANKVYLAKMVVKLPVGFYLFPRNNAIGNGGTNIMIGNVDGTGKYETYWNLVRCGADGSFSTAGHIAISFRQGTPQPTPENPLIAYLASFEAWDVTVPNESIPKVWADQITATSTGVTGLNTRVTNVEGLVTSQGTAITGLQGSVSTINGTLQTKADQSTVNTLSNTVTTQGNTITTQGQAITGLQGSVNTLDGKIATKAEQSAVNTLAGRVTVTEGLIDVANSNVLALSSQINNGNVEIHTTGNVDFVNGWRFMNSANLPIDPAKINLVADASAVSGKVLRVGNNTAPDFVKALGNTLVPIDPNKMYRLRYRFKRVAGTGSVYVGLACTNADKTYNIASNNTILNINEATSSLYAVTGNVDPLDTYVVGEYYFKGKSAGAASGNGTKVAPRTFPALAAYFRGMFLANYPNSPAGQQDFDYFIVEDYDSLLATEQVSTAVSQLSTTVTNQGNTQVSQGAAITALTARIGTAEISLGNKAEQTALNATNATVTKQGNDITTLGSSVTTLQGNLSVSAKAGNNLLVKSNVVGEYDGVAYPHAVYALGTPWELGAKYTLIWCAEHQRGAGDTNSYLGVYVSGGSGQITNITNLPKAVRTFTFTRNAPISVQEIRFYMINRPTADKQSVGTVYWAVLVKGEISLTDDWIPSPYDLLPQVDAAALAIQSLTTTQTSQGNTIVSQGTAITNLQNSLTTTNNNVATKADQTALNTLDNKVSTIDGKVTTQGNSITTLQGNIVTINGTLAQKADSAVLVNYYNKTQADSAIAGGITTYDAGLTVGGENLWSLDGSSVSNEHGVTTRTLVDGQIDHYRYVVQSFSASNLARALNILMLPNNYTGQLIVGEQYTISFKVRASKAAPAFYYAYVGIMSYPRANQPLALTTAWQTMTHTFALTGTAFAGVNQMLCVSLASSSWAVNDWYEIKEVMLQRGTKPTAFVKADGVTKLVLDAQAKAISDTSATVTKQGTDITSLSTQTTYLNNQLNQTNTAVAAKAEQSALNSLDSKVSVIDGKVTTQGNSITQLQGKMTTVESGLSTKVETSALTNYYTKTQADAAAAGQISAFNSSLVIGGVNAVINSEAERTGTGNYILFERSADLKAFYDDNLNKQVTVSCELKVDVATVVRFYAQNSTAHAYTGLVTVPAADVGKWIKYEVTVTVVASSTPTSTVSTLEFYTNTAGGNPAVRKVQLEAGNKATSWSPSPRDVNAALTANANATTNLDTKVTNINNVVTTQGTAITSTQAQLDQQRVGGTNIFKGTKTVDGFMRYTGTSTVTKGDDTSFKTDVVRLTRTGTGAEGLMMRTNTKFKAGTTYKVSFKGRGTVTGINYNYFLRATAAANPNMGLPAPVITGGTFNATTFVTYTITVNNPAMIDRADGNILIGSASGTAGQWFEIAELMVTEGNVLTEWSPSYLDAQELDPTQFASASALSTLDSKVTTMDATLTSQGTAITNVTAQATTTANRITVTDTRSTNQPPSWYWTNYPKLIVNEFKQSAALGLPAGFPTYVNLETRVYYSDASGGNIIQRVSAGTSALIMAERYSSGSGAAAVWAAWGQPLKTINDTLTAQVNAQSLLDAKVTTQGNDITALGSQLTTVSASLTDQIVAVRNRKKVTVDLTSLNVNTYYPVTMNMADSTKIYTFEVNVPLGTYPASWSTHNSGTYSLLLRWSDRAVAWGANNSDRTIEKFGFLWTAQSPVQYIVQMNNTSNAVVHLRGGTKYDLYVAEDITPILRTAAFTSNNETVSPSAYQAAGVPQTLQGDIQANATAQTALDAKVSTIDGKVTTQASQITTLQSTQAGMNTTIQQQASTIDGINAKYTVKINNNGAITGYGLISTMNNGVPTSAFTVMADAFTVYSPTGNKIPFAVITSAGQVVDGNVYPEVGVYMRNGFLSKASITTAHIIDGSITNAKIGYAAVDNAKIADLAVTTGKIANLSVETLKIKDNAVTIPYSYIDTVNRSGNGTVGQVYQQRFVLSTVSAYGFTPWAMVQVFIQSNSSFYWDWGAAWGGSNEARIELRDYWNNTIAQFGFQEDVFAAEYVPEQPSRQVVSGRKATAYKSGTLMFIAQVNGAGELKCDLVGTWTGSLNNSMPVYWFGTSTTWFVQEVKK